MIGMFHLTLFLIIAPTHQLSPPRRQRFEKILSDEFAKMDVKLDKRFLDLDVKIDRRFLDLEKEMKGVQYDLSQIKGHQTEESMKEKLDKVYGPKFTSSLVINGLETLVESLIAGRTKASMRKHRKLRLIDKNEICHTDITQRKMDLLIDHIYDNKLMDIAFLKLLGRDCGATIANLVIPYNISIEAVLGNRKDIFVNRTRCTFVGSHRLTGSLKRRSTHRSLLLAGLKANLDSIHQNYTTQISAYDGSDTSDLIQLKEETRKKYLQAIHPIILHSKSQELKDLHAFGMKTMIQQRQLLKSNTGIAIMALACQFERLDSHFPLTEIEIDCYGYRKIEPDLSHATMFIGEIKTSQKALDLAIKQANWKLFFLCEMIRIIYKKPKMKITNSAYIFLPFQEKPSQSILHPAANINIEYY